MNLLFDRETMTVTGRNRPALPFEVEIKDASEAYVQVGKTIQESFEVPMVADDGSQLYTLVTPVYEQQPQLDRYTSTEPSEEPVMVEHKIQVPLMRDGVQLMYYPRYTVYEQVDVDGELVELPVEHVSDVGIPLFTTEVEMVQAVDAAHELLYWHERDIVVSVQTGETIEHIPNTDARWHAELPKSTQTEFRPRAVTLQEEPQHFTYEDVVQLVKKPSVQEHSMLPLLVYSECESEALFSTDIAKHDAHMGVGVIAIPAGGQLRTEKLPLGIAVSSLELYIESSQTLSVYVGATAAELIPFEDGIASLPTAASDVYVTFKNTSTKAIDIHAFGLFG